MSPEDVRGISHSTLNDDRMVEYLKELEARVRNLETPFDIELTGNVGTTELKPGVTYDEKTDRYRLNGRLIKKSEAYE